MILLGPFNQIIPFQNTPLKGSLRDDELQVISNGGALLHQNVILEVGQFAEMRQKYGARCKLIERDSRGVLLPGLIDCHTHIVYGGSRAMDYMARINGESYLDIAGKGGGIQSTVSATRSSSESELIESALQRILTAVSLGVTTLEIKSGYGLNVEEELRILKTIQEIETKTDIDIIPTCLAAHTFIKNEYESPELYLDQLIDELLPIIKKENLSSRQDIFIDKAGFPLELSEQYVKEAKKIGFDVVIHGDQFTTGGTEIGVRNGAMSVDHLECISDSDIELISSSDTVGTILPGASLGLGMDFAPARKLLDQGASIAIASDWNPGSAPMGDLLTQATLLSVYEKLSFSEVLAGMTFRAAKALGLDDRGRLSKGAIADLAIFPTSDYRDILYYQGSLKPQEVWKNGQKIYAAG